MNEDSAEQDYLEGVTEMHVFYQRNRKYRTKIEYEIPAVKYEWEKNELVARNTTIRIDAPDVINHANIISFGGQLVKDPIFFLSPAGKECAYFQVSNLLPKTKNGRNKAAPAAKPRLNKNEKLIILDVICEDEEQIDLLKRHAVEGAKIKCEGRLCYMRPDEQNFTHIKSRLDFKRDVFVLKDMINFFQKEGCPYLFSLADGFDIDRTVDHESKKERLSLDVQNDIAEYYDRIANMTDYTKSYGQRLVSSDFDDKRSADDLFNDYIPFTKRIVKDDIIKEMVDIYFDNKTSMEETSDETTCYITVNQLNSLGMKSFKRSGKELRHEYIDIKRHFTGQPAEPRYKRWANQKEEIMPKGYDLSLFKALEEYGVDCKAEFPSRYFQLKNNLV